MGCSSRLGNTKLSTYKKKTTIRKNEDGTEEVEEVEEEVVPVVVEP